ncbi:MFS transporter [Burkholderia sp. MR1-5-21]
MTSTNAQQIPAAAGEYSTPSYPAIQNESAWRLDRLEVGFFHYRVMAIIGAGLLVESYENFLASSVLAALQKEGWTNIHITSLFLSVTFAGLLVGGLLAGILGDHVGRKKGYQLNLLLFGGGGFAAFFAPNMDVLIALRFIMGIGIGSEIVLGYSTLAEFVPPSKRGRLFAILSFVTHGGGFFASIIGAAVIPTLGWRWMFMIAAIGAAIVWYFRRYMPESPRWLESRGRFDEARAVMDQIEAVAYKGKVPPLIPPATICEAREAESKPIEQARAWDLFKPKYLRTFIVGLLVMVTMQVCLYGIVMWMPTFFVSQGYTMQQALKWNAIVAFGQPVSSIALIFVVDKIGRKALLIGSSALSVALSTVYITSNDQPVIMLLTTGFVFMVMSQILMTVGQGLYLSEIFPTKLRSRGVGFVSSVSRAIQIGVQAAIPAIYGLYKVAGIMVAADFVLVTFAAGLLFLGVETRKRSLEEISN